MSYETSHDHLIDELDRIRVLLERSRETDPPSLFDDTPSSQSSPTLDPTELSLALPPDARDALDDRLEEISRHCRETPVDTTLRLRVLAEQFDLSRNHLDVLLAALAPRIHRSFERLYDTLFDDPAVDFLTVEFVEQLFATSGRDRLTAFGLVDDDSPLRRHDLLRVEHVDGEDRSCRALYPLDHLHGYPDGHDPVREQVFKLQTRRRPFDLLKQAYHVKSDPRAVLYDSAQPQTTT